MSHLLRTSFNSCRSSNGIFNWTTPQAAKYQTVEEYIADAEKLKENLDAYAQFLKRSLGIQIEFSKACVKSAASATRKLNDGNVLGCPEYINDYLRIKGEITSTGKKCISDTIELMEYLEGAEETLGFKNQIAFPEPETGMRAMKTHTIIRDPSNPDLQMTAEILIGNKAMKDAYEITEQLRGFERPMRQAFNVFTNSKTIARAEIARKAIRELRHAIHNDAAQKCGWDKLVDPSVRHLHVDTTAGVTAASQQKFRLGKPQPLGQRQIQAVLAGLGLHRH